MNVRLVFALFPLLFLGSSVYAQSPCSDCLMSAEEELKVCLDNAISANDKVSCEENRQAHAKVCSTRVCKIERDEGDSRNEQQTPNRPGLTPYTPTQIEWLALIMRAGLRQDASTDHPYSLDIIRVDHETLLIVVRYHPTVNREIINRTIDTAREAINGTAKSYGWDKWVKIRESVEMNPPPNERTNAVHPFLRAGREKLAREWKPKTPQRRAAGTWFEPCRWRGLRDHGLLHANLHRT
jgi:hypothetical protein